MRRRDQGDKNPDGVTHSIILIQIANQPGISTDEIWDHLHSKKGELLRMSDKNLFYGHLRK